MELSKNISRNGVYSIRNLSSHENPRFELFAISRNAALDADVNRSLNSAQAPASGGGVHELSTGPGELPKLREFTRGLTRKKWERGMVFPVI